MNAIEFRNFSCYYKNKKEYTKAIDNIDLDIEQGELLVVVGESGSGKSTLLKACLGLGEYFEGELIIEGESIENVNLKDGKFAFVRQEIVLYPNLTVYENIAFPLRITKTAQEEVDKRVKDIADIIGMQKLLTRKPRQLSIGQQQRVAIGRALIKNPTFIFFDEPFSSIDKEMRMELRQMVKRIHQQYKPTIVFVTHELSEAFSLADRIAVLENGQITEIGTPEDLATSGSSDLVRIFLNRI